MKIDDKAGRDGFSAVGLFNPKTPENVGSVMRAAACFGVSLVAIRGRRYHGAKTDTGNFWHSIPTIHTEDLHETIPLDCVPVAVELLDSSIDLTSYVHPKRAYYIFGPEDGTLGKAVTSWCRDVIRIPSRYCLNLAACVNVVLYDRMSKEIAR